MASTIKLTPGQAETVAMLNSGASVTHIELWHDEYDGTLAVKVTDDGMIMIGYFDTDGNLVGDWVV